MSDVVYRAPDGKWRAGIRRDDSDEERRQQYFAAFFDVNIHDMRADNIVRQLSKRMVDEVIRGERTLNEVIEKLTFAQRK